MIISSCSKGGRDVALKDGEETLMKKLLMVAVASAAGVAVWRKVGTSKPTQPWATATDKV
ncbi:hypothetical protein Kisp01_60480 [Kineosporia sp. NBRC 101677]|nr:hypothetical protein Kisp01_60480 [Kineosporia sp. NBRC 101677]